MISLVLDRHAGLGGYGTGLMLPLARKSVETLAAGVDPLHAGARLDQGKGLGFPHHAMLCIAAYGFWMTERLQAGSDAGGDKQLRPTPSAWRSRR